MNLEGACMEQGPFPYAEPILHGGSVIWPSGLVSWSCGGVIGQVMLPSLTLFQCSISWSSTTCVGLGVSMLLCRSCRSKGSGILLAMSRATPAMTSSRLSPAPTAPTRGCRSTCSIVVAR